jgi:hypothetical protein
VRTRSREIVNDTLALEIYGKKVLIVFNENKATNLKGKEGVMQ